jgi:DNA-binding GntR family transcriptional regulator
MSLFAPPSSARIDHPSLKDAAVDHIRAEIVSGRLAPGTKIDQDQLAGDLGISRLPVREALIELAARGYVRTFPRRGAFVVELTVDDIQDHFEVLAMLFALAARRAAALIGDDELAALRALHRTIEGLTSPPEIAERNIEFYAAINAIGSSDRLMLTLRFLALALPNDYYRNAVGWAGTETIHRERMLEVLDQRDPVRAAATAYAHLVGCAEVVIDDLGSRGYWVAPA